MLLMLPLFAASPLALIPGVEMSVWNAGIDLVEDAPWVLPVFAVAGILLLFLTLRLARGVGTLHGQLAKHLLVKSPAGA